MKITTLQARAAKVASKDYARPVLNAILVEADGKYSAVVATDSYRLLAITTPSDQPKGKAIYTLEGVNQAVAIAKIKKTSEVELDGPMSDGKFPDWRKIKPSTLNDHMVRLNRKYLIDLLQAIDEDTITLTVPENNLAAITITAQGEPNHEYYGLLMPMRG
jgi:DNA polymerase III sliding clamp (beta) subunit (PCNA family)